MLTLTNRFAIYIPSKDKDGGFIPYEQATEQAAIFFSENLGGATCIGGRGYYVMNSGELVSEKVRIVYGYGDDLAFTDDLIKFAKDLQVQLNQESIAIEVPHDLILVSVD